MSNANKREGGYKVGINWAIHIYAKLALNSYKIGKLEESYFTRFNCFYRKDFM